jgi:photosystem II stability/assembly factor-like uncharacterized protein
MKALFGKLVLILAILVLTSSISAQWRLIPAPTKMDFNSAVQLTDTKAFVVGDNGIMLATNNRGSTWYKINLGTSGNLNSIKFIEGDSYYTSYVVGDLGLILRTDSHWYNHEVISVSTNFYNKDVSFSNESNGIVVGYKYSYSGVTPLTYATILVTHDGGLTWKDKSPMITGRFNSVITFDNDYAIVVGDAGLVAITADRGENWYMKRITGNNLNEVKVCPGGIKIIVGENGALFISKDQDRYRWVNYSINSAYNLKSVCLKGSDTYVLAGQKKVYLNGKPLISSVVLELKDLNGNWKEVFSTTAGPLNAVNFCRNNSAIAVGDRGTIAVYHKDVFQDPIIGVDSPEKIETQNFPNPFNPSTVISFKLPEQTNVELKIYDVLGNEIATLVNESKPAGRYEVEWNASNLPSGVYIYQLVAGTNIQMKKMLLLK